MYCSKCGKENNDTNIYCNHCGEKLEKNTTKTSNNNISNRFTLENNIIVVVAMFIMFIVFYIMILKLMLPAISYELSILSLIGLAMIVAFTGMLVWEIYYLCQRVKAGDALIRFSKKKIKEAGHPDVTVCIITEPGNARDIQFHTGMKNKKKEKTNIFSF